MNKQEITIIDPRRAGGHAPAVSDSPAELAKTQRSQAWANAVQTVAFFGFLSVAFYSTCNAVCG